MRSWFLGNKAAAEEEVNLPEVRETNAFRVAGLAVAAANRTRERTGTDGSLQTNRNTDGGFMSFMARGHDVEQERKVSIAAHNLGEGVQQIVLAAKNKDEWKTELLELLEKEDSDMDVLLQNSHCKRFVLRCMENELPPNLIHCLRLLRVLELQHVTTKQQRKLERKRERKEQRKREKKEKQEEEKGTEGEEDTDGETEGEQQEKDSGVKEHPEDEDTDGETEGEQQVEDSDVKEHPESEEEEDEVSCSDESSSSAQAISVKATKKVSKLLCLLCKDPSVGEQLRPHLFGLLALSGASYPPSGIHVARAAGHVICAFSEFCLSNSLVWFLHDRKMIVHMTDDIKELCGITEVSSTTSSLCLYGQAAEEAGLWVIALKTVVDLVTYSCTYNCVELLKDFDKAGGYRVLYFCIKNSSSRSCKQLLELVTTLACCKTTAPKAPVNGVGKIEEDKENEKLVTNPAAFDIVEDLMTSCVPLLKEYEQVYEGERPDITREESLRELAAFSMRTALNVRFASNGSDSGEKSDLAMELLVTTLQMYSDHAMNYVIVEERHRILSYYLMAFPTFADEGLKVLILKTLEFVLTGVAGTEALNPLKIAIEIFFALCKSLLNGANGIERKKLLLDADLICGTFEKLLEFDSRVGQGLMGGDILSSNLNEILDLVTQATESRKKQKFKSSWEDLTFEVDGKKFRQPPASAPLDHGFTTMCRILRLVVTEQSGSSEPRSSDMDDTSAPMASNLNSLLLTAVNHLGDNSSVAALRVFETKMISHTSAELMTMDMEFVMELLDHFSEMTGRLRGLSIFQRSGQKQVEVLDTKKHYVRSSTILREARVYNMLKNVLERSTLAQEAFRINGGFESIIRTMLCLDDVATHDGDDDIGGNDEELEACTTSTMDLLETCFGLLSAATLPHARQKSPNVNSSLLATGDMFTEESLASPAACNLHYLNQRGFFFDYATAITGTGILTSSHHATLVVNLILAYMHPDLKLQDKEERKRAESAGEIVTSLRSPDASRLLLGVATCLPLTESDIILSKRALDEMLRLCALDTTTTTLSQIASCGLCCSITNRKDFVPMLEDRTHHLYSRFVLLLRRIAAFSMSYMDFLSMLRCVAGPILKADSKDNRIRLPVVSSSVRSYTRKSAMSLGGSDFETWEDEEADFCIRLETLSVIAERGDRVARCELGGGSLNAVLTFKQRTKVEDLFSLMSESTRLKFIQIESIDSSAVTPSGLTNAGTPSPFSSAGERIWTPLASSGFSYSTWIRLIRTPGNKAGNVFILDLSAPFDSRAEAMHASIPYFSLWYDVQQQRFTVLSSTSSRNEPTCFPVSSLGQSVWHHVLVTYLPAKRSVISRKATLGLFVDGRPLEAEVRCDNISLPPNACVHIGVPNPYLALTGIVGGPLPLWELGPTLMLSTILSNIDATAIFMHGPDFPGMFWGDRPQRISLAATGTASFAMLAESGEQGSVAGALRRREIHRLEAAGTVNRIRSAPNQRQGSDSLSVLGLLYMVTPDNLLFGFRSAASTPPPSPGNNGRYSRRMLNIAKINTTNCAVSTDAIIYGIGSVASPYCFADNVQWVGGPSVLVPIVNAARSTRSLALALRLIRESVHRHPPNLETLQAGGGYRMLAVLLSQKKIMDASVLDQCFAFAVHGFMPNVIETHEVNMMNASMSTTLGVSLTWPGSERWLFTDLDAMKYLLMNHQVWDMRNIGPDLPLRLVSFLNGLVAQDSAQKAFNSRRLHMLGIVRWTLHLMLEAAELFTLGEIGAAQAELKSASESSTGLLHGNAAAALNSGWYCQAPSVESTSVGGDPDNAMLQGCKTLLRRVLTFMLTPGDLEAIAEATVYTIAITTNGKIGLSGGEKSTTKARDDVGNQNNAKLMPGAVSRVYLLRLIEELVVDGVNEIIASAMEKNGGDLAMETDQALQSHIGGGASTNQSYLTTSMMRGVSDGKKHPKHQQAQAFLSAFAGVLTPVWFACLLEGCHEEASASAVLRLMILMLQSSPMFAEAFEAEGGFAPLVLSIPKYSTCPSIIMSMLSQLLQAHILHLPCLGTLDADQLCEIFDAEGEVTESIGRGRGGNRSSSDPSCGIFALLAECLGRNIQLAPFDNELGRKARQTNGAVLHLLSHEHKVSKAFRDFCRTSDFLEPLAQALCLVHDEKLQRTQQQVEPVETMEASDTFYPEVSEEVQQKANRRGSLSTVPAHVTPTERFVGSPEEEMGSSGFGMVQLLHLVLQHAVVSGPFAAPLVSALFRSFPIHASPEQVEAFHLVLIEHCRLVVESSLETGEPIPLANCIGISSVILDRLMAGFFTSEPVLEAVTIIMLTLKDVTTNGRLGNAEQSILAADAAHLARLTCITALHRSRPTGPYDEGDEDLKIALIDLIAANTEALLIVPTGGQQTTRKQSLIGSSGTGNSAFPTPPPSSRTYLLWKSTSLARSSVKVTYEDLSVAEEPDKAFVVSMMDQIHPILLDSNEELRDRVVPIIVTLLQKRRTMMSDILIVEVPRGDRMETIDIMNRGGFGALLVAHEAAKASGNLSIIPQRSGGRIISGGGKGSKSKYASFFEWLEGNEPKVETVFHAIHVQAYKILPFAEMGAPTPEDAIESEQKSMLLRLTSQDSSDRTILGGLERAELGQRCYDKTAGTHVLWKRQGFDDLASGAMQWKILLRQLKGSCSIWEKSSSKDKKREDEDSPFSPKVLLQLMVRDNGRSLFKKGIIEKKVSQDDIAAVEVVTRWKLDLTEGYERQRRRLLPNYEFHSLYNLDELADHGNQSSFVDDDEEGNCMLNASFAPPQSLEATTALLKDLNLKKTNRDEEDDYDDDADGDEESGTAVTTATSQSSLDDGERDTKDPVRPDLKGPISEPESVTIGVAMETEPSDLEDAISRDNVDASSYDLITGLLKAGDWPEKSYNVQRCTGLEVRKALLLWCREAVYIIDGFEQTDGEGLEGRIKRVEKEQSTFSISLRSQKSSVSQGAPTTDEKEGAQSKSKEQDASEEITYQHRSQRLAFTDLHSVFRRRHELQHVALEFYDIHRSGTLVAFSNNDDREDVLTRILSSPLPNSIFSLSGITINYKKFMNTWKSKIISEWQNGKMTNFDFLMHMNSLAGRTYNDLTQYPVFPWVIADYESEELDLDDPKTYRDLSKPMGAQTEARAQSFRDRYEALEDSYMNNDGVPPFHYGTHYSCAAYVLYYLMRLEPFSRLALILQGGHFDVADRLFHNVGSSWRSASSENVQDVRELIPEFFYLPEFLENRNNFDFGVTQGGKTIHDASLPPWAHGDPKRFVRLNRQALESDYVSKNLHRWIDLVFGYKQRGHEAVNALNVFMHVTYEGEVDLATMKDPIQRASTLAQIQNFGQTPSRLERKPFPQRFVVTALRDYDKNMDFGSFTYLAPLTPPFCVVGAPHRSYIRPVLTDHCRVGMAGQVDSSVGDMCLVRGHIVGVGRSCVLIIPVKRYFRFGGPNNGVSVHVASPSSRYQEINKMLTVHDGMHRAPISAAAASLNGHWLVTGCIDSTVRVWKYDNQNIVLKATLCGHEGGRITCIDVSTVFGMIATGSANGDVLLWDLRTLTFMRRLRQAFKEEAAYVVGSIGYNPAVSVSINHKNGYIVTLVGSHLSIFDINGSPLASVDPGSQNRATCAVATDCPEWMEQGIVVVTGHLSGEIRLWSLDHDRGEFIMRHLMPDNPHSCPITALRVAGDRQETLLVGDKSGRMTLCKTMQLESLSQDELSTIVEEVRSKVKISDTPLKRTGERESHSPWMGS